MNYEKIYLDLINRRKLNPLPNFVYSERHHILPRSLGGSNEPSNLIRLSIREHYIAHLLLTQMFKIGSVERYKMLCAFMMMNLNSESTNRPNSRTSRIYEKLRIEWINHMSIFAQQNQSGTKNSQFGTCWVNKENIDKKIKKEDLSDFIRAGWMTGRYSEKPIKLTVCKFCKTEFLSSSGKYCSISCANKDRTLSTDTKNKIRNSKVGHIVTQETKEKISISQKKYYGTLKS